jgi:hypothetical protein
MAPKVPTIPSNEPTTPCITIERARNEAIRWLEDRGVVFGPRREMVPGRLGVLTGKEVGVSSEPGQRPFWRLRLDYDPDKGPHFNAEYESDPRRQKQAFTFIGSDGLMRTLAKSRDPR